MDEQAIMLQNDDIANRLVARCMRYTTLFTILIWVLNQFDVFILDKPKLTMVVIFGAVILSFPTIIVNFLAIKSGWVKYFNVILAIAFVNALYVLLGYHAVLILILPSIVAFLYFNHRLMVITCITNVIFMFASHVLSVRFTISPDDPLILLYDSLVYGFVPRSLAYVCMSVLIMIATSRCSKMLRQVINYSDEISRSAKGLDSIVVQTQKFFVARNTIKLTRVIISAITDVVSTQQSRPTIPMGYLCFKANDNEDGEYFYIDQSGMQRVLTSDNRQLMIDHKQDNAHVPLDYTDGIKVLTITENGVGMSFYENDILIGYCNVAVRIDKNIADIENILDILYVNIKLAIINTRLNDNMFKNQLEIIFAFAEISESKSEQTGKHIKRVAEYMKVLGEHFGLDEHEREALSIASMMHDIGKLMVPDEILEKKGKLTLEEFSIIKKHIHYGYTLLEHSPGRIMKLARTIAHQHHEKWDGNGYMGLKGEQIDFYSRLMAVADVFDALVSKRSYKEKWLIEDAYNEIVSQSGKHFDPQVVEAFKGSFERFRDIVNSNPDE